MALKRPHPKNYAMYDAKGKAKYQADLKKYLADKKAADAKKTAAKKPAAKKPVAKKPVAKKPVAKKPVAKKPVAKKPVAKKPVAKKPVAKKPVAKKPVAKKPVAKKSANNLRIKKAASTTRKALKKAAPVVKKAVQKGKTFIKNQKAKFAKDQTPQQANPTPKTKGQKLMSRINKSYQNYKGQVLDKAGKDLGKKGKLRSGLGDKSLKAQSKSGTKASLAAGALTLATNALVDRAFKPKNMTMAEYRKAKEKSNQEGVGKAGKRVKKAIKGVVNKFRGKSNNTTTKKTTTTTTKPSSKLKIAQDRVKKAKGYNKEKLQREVDYQKKLGKQGRTWSNPVGAKGKGKPSTVKQEPKKVKKESKYIKTASGSLARRGTVGARKAENRERARKRAQEMARKRLANK